ncbi:VPGUxxT family thioredoxin-like (seleno)protein, type 2 [Luteolibacter algae]|uniref:VPGUxxT family thioredoxin-like (Seleno)protein, type 2 n=1 Tax=Luteolibacter algae TaxID=454151 RepID=A0ABW5D7X5_9BACT
MKGLFLLALTTLVLMSCQTNAENPIEVGTVKWGRDLPAALATSKQTGKPIFLLFQEVPGCAGCKQFGRDVLSDPSVVESIETDFIPLLIHNNKGGKDAEVLRQYKEPAWNFQVVRFLDSTGKDLIPRKDKVWTAAELKPRMAAALKKAGQAQAAALPRKARVALCQYCFWTGEMKIGAIEGVCRTEAGFFDGREVTLVEYDPARTSIEEIVSQAKAAGVASAVYLDDPSQYPGSEKLSSSYRPAPPGDQKRQLQGTAFAKLNLSPEQATKVNAFARTNPSKALQYLTPAQRKQLAR